MAGSIQNRPSATPSQAGLATSVPATGAPAGGAVSGGPVLGNTAADAAAAAAQGAIDGVESGGGVEGRAVAAQSSGLARETVTPELLGRLRALRDELAAATGARSARADIEVATQPASPQGLAWLDAGFVADAHQFVGGVDLEQPDDGQWTVYSSIIGAAGDLLKEELPKLTADAEAAMNLKAVAGWVGGRNWLQDLPGGLSTSSGGQVSGNVPSNTPGDVPAGSTPPLPPRVKSAWEKAIDRLPVDINSLVQWVLRVSYLESCEDLKMYAEKVKFFNEKKKEIREELKRARGEATKYAGLDDDAEIEPFATRNIGTKYDAGEAAQMGIGMSDTVSEAQIAEAKQQKAERDALRAQHAEVLERWKNTEGEPESIRIPTIEVTGDAARKSYNGSMVNHEIAKDQARAYVTELRAYYDGLPEDEKQAFLESLKTDGISINFGVRNSDWGMWGDSQYPYTMKAPADCEDPMQFIEDSLMNSLADMASKEIGGGKDTDWISIDVDLNNYNGTVSQPPPKDEFLVDPNDPTKGTLAELEAKLGVSEEGDGWTEGQACDTKAELETYMKNLEDKLSIVGDDAQLANVDLQNVLQKQQQTMQMMTNLSKQLHDTALNTIRKIGS